MTHLLYLHVEGDLVIKYPLMPYLSLKADETPHLDLIEFSASWDGRSQTILPYTWKRFFAWDPERPGIGFSCPYHDHSVGLVGYHGWMDISELSNETKKSYNFHDLEIEEGWVLIADNHDSPGGDLIFGSLWLWLVQGPIKIYKQLLHTKKPLDLTDQVKSFLLNHIIGLRKETNPLCQPRAGLISEKQEERRYRAVPEIKLEDIHVPLSS